LLKSESGGEDEARLDFETRCRNQETVIVTSQYRKERLQDTQFPSPLCPLRNSPGAMSLICLRSQAAVPGIFVSAANATNGTNLISLRGISGLAAAGGSQAAAVYLDGLYFPRPRAGLPWS
jgi:hypothetical protein